MLKVFLKAFIAGLKETPRGYFMPLTFLSIYIEKLIIFTDQQLARK